MVLQEFEDRMNRFNRILREVKGTDDFERLSYLERAANSQVTLLSEEVSESSRLINNHLLEGQIKNISAKYLWHKYAPTAPPEPGAQVPRQFTKDLRAMYNMERLYNKPLVKKQTAESIFTEVLNNAFNKKRYELTVGMVLSSVLKGNEIKLLVDRRTTRVVGDSVHAYRTDSVWPLFDQWFGLAANGIDRNSEVPYSISIRLKDYQNGKATLAVSVFEKEISDRIIKTRVNEYELSKEFPR